MRETSAAELLDALGGPDADRVLDAFCARGPGVIAELFAALLAPPAAPSGDRNGRAVHEDEERCLHRLAAAHPQEFLAELGARPELADRLTVMSALVQVPGPDADRLLLTALRHAGGWHRWLALRGLLARDCDAVAPHLPALLRDRDSTVGFVAVEGLRRWGRASDVAALLAYAATAPIGGVEFARDAIETICARDGLPLPPEHPGARLTTVTASGERIALDVFVPSQVAAGELLGHVNGEPLRSPCAGVVSAIDRARDRLCVTIRRTA